MKAAFLGLGFAAIACGLFASCGTGKSNSATEQPANQLTAEELARLLNFHVWKTCLSPQQQQFQTVRLVIVKPDGTAVPKFDCGSRSTPLPYFCFLIGLRFEHETFSGTFEAQDAKGGRVSWDLSFTGPSAETLRSSGAGTLHWQDDRAELATFWDSGRTNYDTLALELVK